MAVSIDQRNGVHFTYGIGSKTSTTTAFARTYSVGYHDGTTFVGVTFEKAVIIERVTLTGYLSAGDGEFEARVWRGGITDPDNLAFEVVTGAIGGGGAVTVNVVSASPHTAGEEFFPRKAVTNTMAVSYQHKKTTTNAVWLSMALHVEGRHVP